MGSVDNDQADSVAPDTTRSYFRIKRAGHFAEQGKRQQAAVAMRQIAQNSTADQWEWWHLRDAVMIYAMSGDKINLAKSAAECNRRAAVSQPDDCKWVVLTMLFAPGTITDENRPAVLKLADKADDWWEPRLHAPIAFQSGDYARAADLFDANVPNEYSYYMAAMVYHLAGNTDRAKRLLKEGNAWVRERQATDPGAAIPRLTAGRIGS